MVALKAVHGWSRALLAYAQYAAYLGWSRRLGKGRARTVRQTVLAAAVSVMLVPLASDSQDVGHCQAAEPL
jgi:hypothetical protein